MHLNNKMRRSWWQTIWTLNSGLRLLFFKSFERDKHAKIHHKLTSQPNHLEKQEEASRQELSGGAT